jgi:WhiB family redox-sensing transcriptional regulator
MPRISEIVPVPDERWRDEASCRGTSPEIFYPPSSGRMSTSSSWAECCDSCPVRVTGCLAHALLTPENFGIWGGMSSRERDRLVRRLRRGTESWDAVESGVIFPRWKATAASSE